MSNGKPFKARLGLDANNEKVLNVKAPESGTDAVNLSYYVANNTVQSFSSSRAYPANFIVEYDTRLWKSKGAVAAGSFNEIYWTEIHAFGKWSRVSANYQAEPGDNLIVATGSASVTITLPAQAEDGDVVFLVDDGNASTNPIVVNPGSNTVNGAAGNYEMNSEDSVYFIYVGGTWRTVSSGRTSFGFKNTNFTARPNSWNLVDTNAARTVTLPSKPKEGQHVVVQDSSNKAQTNNITVVSSTKTIQGSAQYKLIRNSEIAVFVFDRLSDEWKISTNRSENRIVETLAPIPNQQVIVALDGTTKTLNLPSGESGDWVEVIITNSTETAAGSVVVNASSGTTFANDPASSSTVYRLKKRSRVLFVLKGTVWGVVTTEDGGDYAGSIGSGTLTRNSVYTYTGGALLLPSRDSLQIGDKVTVQIAGTGSVSVSDTVNERIGTGSTTSESITAADAGMFVSYVYVGLNNSQHRWVKIDHAESALKKTKNLSDLPDKAASRTALEVFSKTESDERFLALHGKADTAVQADNADKLDNLDSSGFIQVKNPSIAAVDANTTTETRFTTNLNTPNNTELWQVVMFVDQTSGDKAQIAMGKTSNKIAYRAYSAGAWTPWSYLDQSANSATATKLANARTISLTGDATGSGTFDGSNDLTLPVTNVNASGLKAVATTNDTGGGIGVKYTKIASILMPRTTDKNLLIRFVSSSRKVNTSLGGQPIQSDVTLFIRGGAVTLKYGAGGEFGYVINGDYTDLYVKPITSSVVTCHEVSRNAPDDAVITWLSAQPILTTAPDGYVAGLRDIDYTDSYHPLADKWTTPRKISFTGGLNGEVTLDGSGDVVLESTINVGATQFEISNVNGLQDALNGKLSAGGKAADADKLDGIDSLDYRKAVAANNQTEDPNTTVKELILTNHTNGPDGGTAYWYIETTFYIARGTGSNRFQIASKYNGGAGLSFRQYYNGVWSDWAAISAIIDGATYPINVSGTSGEAAVAVKLKTPVNINGTPFDGSAEITVEDSTKLPKAGGVMTGAITRSVASAHKFMDNPFNYTIDAGTVTGTLKLTLPVGMNTSMMKFKIHILNYTEGDSAIELDIGGYNHTNGWLNTSAFSNGTDLDKLGATIRFAFDGTKACLLIGTTATAWSYPKIAVTDLMVGHTGASSTDWNGAWAAAFITDEAGITVSQTVAYDKNFVRSNQNNVFSTRQTINYSAGTAPTYAQAQLELNSGGTNPVVIGFHRPGYTGCSLVHSSDGLILTDTTYASRARFEAGALVGATLSTSGEASVASLSVAGSGFTSSGSTHVFNSWVRTTGSAGWHSNTYGGGIYMIDTTWVRIYGSKAFYVANEIAATGNITAYYSDARLKENLKPIPNAMDTVRSWTGYTYNANVVAQSFGYDPAKKEIGLLAQDVQKTTPEAVEPAPFDRTNIKGKSLTGQHYLTLKYDRLVPVLVEAIKEQDKEIQALKEQVQFLMEQFNNLNG